MNQIKRSRFSNITRRKVIQSTGLGATYWGATSLGVLGANVMGGSAGVGENSYALAKTTIENDSYWQGIRDKARGQDVFWHAWGGNPLFNTFMTQQADTVRQRYGVNVNLVRLSSTSEAVARVIAESLAGNDDAGSIDMVWINGENFYNLMSRNLLFGPFVDSLPNSQKIDTKLEKLIQYDATHATKGYEAPWGRAQLGYVYDSKLYPNPPKNTSSFLDFAKENPNRLTYPAPPDFVGRTFLKQLLFDLVPERQAFYTDAKETDATLVISPLWRYLDQLHPHLWRRGKGFVNNATAMITMLGNKEIAIAITFNVGSAYLWKKQGQLSSDAQLYFWDAGSIGNVNFLAIPFNARAKEGAMVMINHLLSPRAQAQRQNPEIWGDLSVLDIQKLTQDQKALFTQNNESVQPSVIPDFHSSWDAIIDREWQQRYRN